MSPRRCLRTPGLVGAHARLRLAAWLLVLAAPAVAANPLHVVSSDPAAHALGVPTATHLRVAFDTDIDPATVDATTVQVFGRWSGPVPGVRAVLADGVTLEFAPLRPFFPGEQVRLSLSAGLRALTGERLTGGWTCEFWAGSAPGAGSFALTDVLSTRLPGEGFVKSYGIYAGDLDRDGAPDFSIPNELGDDVRVLRNDGCGAFGPLELHPLPLPATPSANEGADFDADGVLDLAVAHIDGAAFSVLRGDGQGSYLPPVLYPVGLTPRGLAVLDADGDGDADIVTAHRGSSDLALSRNDGAGLFAPAQFFDGGGQGETSVVATDADLDGCLDLFVANHDSDEASLLLNDGHGAFSVSDVAGVGSAPWMAGAADVTGDGVPDFATADAFSASLSLLHGDGAGGLAPAGSLPIGTFPIAVDFGDLDADGDLDAVGSSFIDAVWTVWWNDGAGGFPSATQLPATSAASCATLVDFDRDGLLDLVGIDEVADEVSLYRQTWTLPAAIQPASCTTALRLDNLAVSAGYAGPFHEARLGGTLHVGVSGRAGDLFGVFLGLPVLPGATTAYGIFNLEQPLLLVLAGPLDTHGEATFPIAVNPALPVGLPVGVQAHTGSGPGTWVLGNPEMFVFVN